MPGAGAPGEVAAGVGGQRGEVEWSLRIVGQDDQLAAGRDARQRGAGAQGGEGTGEPTGVDRLRHPARVVAPLAVVLEADTPTRLYTGLSLLVSAAVEGRPVRALAGFGPLPILLGVDTLDRDDRFGRSLAELIAAAREVPDLRMWACAAAVDLLGVERDRVERHFDGVLSMPRFLAEVAGAELLFV